MTVATMINRNDANTQTEEYLVGKDNRFILKPYSNMVKTDR
jgi:hypothetical protein